MEYKKNDYLTLTITDMGSDGEGIGKMDGFAIFVKDAVIGDTIEAKIVKSKKNYAYARLEKILEPSPFRTEPKCAFHRQCGGCQIQALSYGRQLDFKQEKILNHLVRIGGFEESLVKSVMEPVIGMENPFHYRNKAQYPVGTNKNGEIITGFYAGHTHDIIANTDCLLGAAENKKILEAVLDYMRENHVSAYDETTGKGLIRHILIRTGYASKEIMVCLVINKPVDSSRGKQYLPNQQKLLDKLGKIENMASISINFNTEKTNVILGKEVRTLWGKDTISDTIRIRNMSEKGYPFTGQQLSFQISPLSFYQVNPVQTEKLYSLALEYASLTGKETVWDLYCGIGTISLFLSTRAQKVCGVEVVPRAIEDAKENAKRNHIENVEFFVGNAEKILPEYYEKGEGKFLHPDVIVVDPPRKGCDAACLETMIKMEPERIVYVSCDSATMARDLKILCGGGFELKRVRGVDQFAQTVGIETVVLLERNNMEPKEEKEGF